MMTLTRKHLQVMHENAKSSGKGARLRHEAKGKASSNMMTQRPILSENLIHHSMIPVLPVSRVRKLHSSLMTQQIKLRVKVHSNNSPAALQLKLLREHLPADLRRLSMRYHNRFVAITSSAMLSMKANCQQIVVEPWSKPKISVNYELYQRFTSSNPQHLL